MDGKAVTFISMLIAAPAAGAFAQPAPAMPAAATYADLLEPIPNAVERLKLDDALATSRPALLIQAQYHHHHHHHHNFYPPVYRAPHYVYRPRYYVHRYRPHYYGRYRRPHYHHHHHHSYYRAY